MVSLKREETTRIQSLMGIEEDLIHAHMTNIIQKIHFSDIARNHFNDKVGEGKIHLDHLELT